ncbi:hypothetical protein OYC64_004814 [Pagothenia borchgrevinki]|uniref:Uncharacterized protein n=1 Tax=Pagothenia borchgrevinki TaxID=8213 RepID=A0ABD2GDS2_PAGBO
MVPTCRPSAFIPQVRYDVDDGTVNYENIRPPDGV